jgi:hypothetical protein
MFGKLWWNLPSLLPDLYPFIFFQNALRCSLWCCPLGEHYLWRW